MSLLNDALMDLDRTQRKITGKQSADQTQDALLQKRSSPELLQSLKELKRYALPLIAVLMVVYWLAFEKKGLSVLLGKTVPISEKSEPTNNAKINASINPMVDVKKAPELTQTTVAQKAIDLPPIAVAEKNGVVGESTLVDEVNASSKNITNIKTRKQDAVLSESSALTIPSAPMSKMPTAKATVAHLSGNTQTPSANVTHREKSSDAKAIVPSDYDIRLAEQIHTDRYTRFESKAWSLIDSGESSRFTSMALADVYSANKNIGQLLQLMNRVRNRDPVAAAYVQSQWLIIHGDLHGAAGALEPHKASSLHDGSLIRLLAGVYSGLNDYGQALPLYQQLTELPGFNINDWLGYAIALEHRGDAQAARQAYEKISGVPHADRRINGFVNERIRELAKKDNR